MRKFRLDVEELTVESFATASAFGAMGTVRAHAFIEDTADDGAIEIITAPPPPPPPSVNCSANPYTECQSCVLSCVDTCNQPTCDSCHITMCRANCG
jgi:hypothetical protein